MNVLSSYVHRNMNYFCDLTGFAELFDLSVMFRFLLE